MLNNAVYEVRPFVMPLRRKFYSLKELEVTIEASFMLDPDALKLKKRIRPMVIWRHIFYLIARSCGHSTVSIGRFLGFNHATVIHGSNAAIRQLETDPILRNLLSGKLPPALWAKIKPKTVVR